MGIDHPFAGHALNAVDAKGRVSVPAAVRSTVGQRLRANGVTGDDKSGSLMLSIHPKGDRLLAYDPVGMDQLTRDLRVSVSGLPIAEQRDALDKLRRAEIGNMVPVPYDAAGRMVLPPILRKLGGIGELAYFMGVDDHLEIWAPSRAEAAFADEPMMLAVLRSYLEAREA